MKHILGLLHSGNGELLSKALAGVGVFNGRIHIIDNAEIPRLPSQAGVYTVYAPPVPLTFTQGMNWLQIIARGQQCDVLFFMHDDGTVTPERAAEFLAYVRGVWERKEPFGVIFTLYDVFCAFNMAACNAVGPWDTIFVQYFADNDYYRRLEAAGYPRIEAGGAGVTHVASATLKASKHSQTIAEVFGGTFAAYYARKYLE